MNSICRRDNILRRPEYWITTAIAILAGLPVAYNFFVDVEHLVLTPITADFLTGDFEEQYFLGLEFSLANTGNRPVTLAELCLMPRLWPARGSIYPQEVIPGKAIQAVDGIAWLASTDGKRRLPITMGAGDLQASRVYFDLRLVERWARQADQPDDIELDIYATIVDHNGVIRRTKLFKWLALSGPKGLRLTFSP